MIGVQRSRMYGLLWKCSNSSTQTASCKYMSDNDQPLIPREEIDALARRVDEAKPWESAAYSITLPHRRYYCTIFATAFALSVAPSILVGAFIVLPVFVYDLYMGKHAYDMRLSGVQLVHIMYETGDQEWIKSGELKKHLFCYVTLLFLGAIILPLLAWLGILNATLGKYLYGALPIAIAMVCSYTLIQKKVCSPLVKQLDGYEKAESMYGKNVSPFSGMYYHFLPDRTRRAVDAIVATWMPTVFVLFLYIFLTSNFEALSKVDEGKVFWPPVVLAAFLFSSACFYPNRLFALRCVLIDDYRRNHMEE